MIFYERMKNMDVTSFGIDHDRLLRGIYVSRKDTVGNGVLTTFDIRMKEPNREMVMDTSVMHTIEHLMAVYLREHPVWAEQTIYVGPMGCRTGFYLLMSGGTEKNAENFAALCTALDNILAHEGKMPGAARRECGNFRALSLKAAKDEARKYLEVLDPYRRAGTLPTFEYEGGRSGI